MNEISFELLDKDDLNFELETTIKKVFPPLENLEVTPSGQEQNFKSENYYGYDNVKVNAINLQDKTITPSRSQEVVVADDGYTGLDNVTIEAVTSEIDSNIKASNIRLGVNILGVEGNLEPDKPDQSKTVSPSKEQQIILPDTGYELSQVTVEAIPDSYVEPSGNLEITTNGEYDVTNYEKVNADIHEPTPYAPRHISFINYGGTELDYEINNLDVSNLTTFEEMFSGCRKITNLDLNHWNTSKITNMSGMFSGCPYLENINIENWDTSKVTDMSYMFYSCNNLESLDVSNFDTTNVTDMSYMFSAISNKMTTLDLSSFNTSKVTSMRYMFYWSYPLTNLNISNFDTTNVTGMTYMFNGCRNIKDLDLSSFDASKVTNISYAFNGTTGLENVIFMNNLGKGFTSKSNNSSYYLLNFSEATKLTHDSLMDIINKLYDLNLSYDVANGGTLYTQILMLGATNLAKLTVEEIAIATNKGWTVS